MRLLLLRVTLIPLSMMMKSSNIPFDHFTVLAGRSSDEHEWDLLVIVANYAFDSFPSEKHRIALHHIISLRITSPLISAHNLTSSHVHWHPVFRGFVIQVHC